MAQIVVRNLEDDVKESIKRLATRHGRSMESEVRQILQDAARASAEPTPKLGSRIAARFAKVGLTEDLPELRGQAAKPAGFRK